jgi:hypothetical protein
MLAFLTEAKFLNLNLNKKEKKVYHKEIRLLE